MRRSSFTIAIVLLATLSPMPGCKSAGDSSSTAATPDTPPASAALADAAEHTYDATLDTLIVVMPLTFDAMHWGQMHIKREGDTLTAAAVLPNDRQAAILAQPLDAARTNVRIAIGRFRHDPAGEQDFLKELFRQIEKHNDKHATR